MKFVMTNPTLYRFGVAEHELKKSHIFTPYTVCAVGGQRSAQRTGVFPILLPQGCRLQSTLSGSAVALLAPVLCQRKQRGSISGLARDPTRRPVAALAGALVTLLAQEAPVPGSSRLLV